MRILNSVYQVSVLCKLLTPSKTEHTPFLGKFSCFLRGFWRRGKSTLDPRLPRRTRRANLLQSDNKFVALIGTRKGFVENDLFVLVDR